VLAQLPAAPVADAAWWGNNGEFSFSRRLALIAGALAKLLLILARIAGVMVASKRLNGLAFEFRLELMMGLDFVRPVKVMRGCVGGRPEICTFFCTCAIMMCFSVMLMTFIVRCLCHFQRLLWAEN
jgi:hypothetical protein